MFSPLLTWHCDFLRSEMSLEQCDKTGNSGRIRIEKGDVQNKCFGMIVQHKSRWHHTSANQRKTLQFWVVYIHIFKFQAMKTEKETRLSTLWQWHQSGNWIYMIKWQCYILWKQEVGGALCVSFMMLLALFLKVGSFASSFGKAIYAAKYTYKRWHKNW